MAHLFSERMPLALMLVTTLGVGCGGDGHHPPPVGDGGRATIPPIISEFGGAHAGGSAGTGTTPGGVPDSFAGVGAFEAGGSVAGDTTGFGFGGSSVAAASFGGASTAGTSLGGSLPTPFGGSNGFSGSF